MSIRCRACARLDTVYRGDSGRHVSTVTWNISTVCQTFEMKKSQAEHESNEEEKRKPYLGRQIRKGFLKNKGSGTTIVDALEMKNINSNVHLDRMSIEM